ncbi:hypothetical protein LTR62_005723 [Meristemomyces frigidus]|uniref:Calcineurin-like phosphoesterase domain-containing protein n=1 Tax=Meristemomyces frigidus TaxID=1508187 RepID=A0AAN7TGL7_9PEZI|nr:hypothetical protein LTR62_005723 [Meristemomyces frigidus]
MRPSDIFLAIFRFLIPPALILPCYVYFYPVLQGCRFPLAKPGEAACYFGDTPRPAVEAEPAPFRLLALADPQLEGDTSLPDPNAPLLPGLGRWREVGVTAASYALVTEDVPRLFAGYRKRVDLWGNDLYLSHIYRTMLWWSDPTHTVVLGDLLGSQWIGHDEFEHRSERFWKTVFKGGRQVGREVTDVSGKAGILGQDKAWRNRIITVAGNHDIGYAGDIDDKRVERFERSFGSVNWDTTFKLNGSTSSTTPQSWTFGLFAKDTTPALHLIILNSMNLDSPAWDTNLQQKSLTFLEDQLTKNTHSPNTGTIILTHVPLHKEPGVCVDSPYFSFFSPDQGGGIREQNHLSSEISSRVLDGLTTPTNGGATRGNAIILNGHDHEGCDVLHYHSPDPNADESRTWQTIPYPTTQTSQYPDTSHLREITVRSMMGSYHGNAGLLSAWYDHDSEEWSFEYGECMFGVQHIWWGVHIFLLLEIGLGVAGLVSWVLEDLGEARKLEREQGRGDKVKRA